MMSIGRLTYWTCASCNLRSLDNLGDFPGINIVSLFMSELRVIQLVCHISSERGSSWFSLVSWFVHFFLSELSVIFFFFFFYSFFIYSLSVCLSGCLSLSIYLVYSLSLYHCFSFSVSIFSFLSLYLHLSLSHAMYLSHSVSIYLYLYPISHLFPLFLLSLIGNQHNVQQ